MNNSSKAKTILLVILIVIALGILFFQVSGKTIFPQKQNNVVEETNQQQVPQNTNQNQVQNTEVNQKTESVKNMVRKSTEGINFSLPSEYNFSVEESTPGGIKSITIGNNSKAVLTFRKFTDKKLFNDFTPPYTQGFLLVNDKYNLIQNLDAFLYKSTELSEMSLIVIPSKMISIEIEKSSFSGVDQKTINNILSSVSFDF